MTFEDMLAAWLVTQRWFAGKGRTVHDLAVVADTEIVPGDPGLRHLIVTVSHGATSDCYQLFVGQRARLPARLRHARIGSYSGLQVYDGLHDRDLTRPLLDAIAAERTIGALRFCRVPEAGLSWAADSLEGLHDESGVDSLVLTGEQSNTSLVFGEWAIFKVFRRVAPGPNPDLEVAAALAARGSTHVAEPYGWIETRLDGATAILAILSRYLRAASDGWLLAATSVRDLYAAAGTRAAEAGGDFAGEAERLGVASSTSKASPPARWLSAAPAPHRYGTWPACSDRSTTRPGTSCSRTRSGSTWPRWPASGSGATPTRSAQATPRPEVSTRPATACCSAPCCWTRRSTRSCTSQGTGRPGWSSPWSPWPRFEG